MSDPIVVILVVAAVVALGAILFVLFGQSRRTAGPTAQPEPVADRPGGGQLGNAVRRIFGGGLTDRTWGDLEEVLLTADVGIGPTTRIVEGVRAGSPKTAEEAWSLVADSMLAEFEGRDRTLNLWGEPAVILVVGVNGTGKTTTVAKLANHLKTEGRSVLLAAADTFRAAGSDQLEVWAQRIGVPVVTGQEGGDAAAVVHDALASARARSVDVVIVDTAGRLHANKNLMAELEKVHRVAGGREGVGEVLLVIDASAGQNGLAQAREFASSVPLTGVALAKLDGTAKGGIVVAIEATLGVPVKLVGTGETVTQLQPFDPTSFVASLLAR